MVIGESTLMAGSPTASLAAVVVSVFAHAGLATEAGTPSPPLYNEAEALRFVQYARAAFCTKESVESWDCGEACEAVPMAGDSVRFFGPSSTWALQGYVAKTPSSDGRCVVSFRGSVAWENWLADADFLRRPWPPQGSGRENPAWCEGCEVNTGFAQGYEEVRPSVLAFLRDLGCTSAAVTGHSLGGALASLATLDFRAELGMSVPLAYTFGKPRVGNLAYVNAFMAAAAKQGAEPASWRVVHYHDPVPRLQIPAPFEPSAHEVHEVYYDKKDSSSFRECESGKLVNGHEDPTCSRATSLFSCIGLDHIHYLNKSFAHTYMDVKCVGQRELMV